jgi:uncharacterized membrane protein YphA (DoxX/SURF4 family)
MSEAKQDYSGVKAIALRAAGISLGFVFFSAAWRRFVNMPAKLAIQNPQDVANKLVEAAPGSPIAPAIHWLLDKPQLTEIATYAMSVAEAAIGFCLMAGLFTRLAAAGAALLNVCLMLIFGWEGFECLDEWTMSALGFALSVAIMLHGPSRYSFDELARFDPFARLFTRRVAEVLTLLAVIFTLGFYEYYFGVLDLHRLTGIKAYNIVAEKVADRPDAVALYVNAGSSSGAAYLQSIDFTLADGSSKTVSADQIDVLKSHFMPWSQSGMLVDGFLKLRLGSVTDIAVPEGARAAKIAIVGNPPIQVRLP